MTEMSEFTLSNQSVLLSIPCERLSADPKIRKWSETLVYEVSKSNEYSILRWKSGRTAGVGAANPLCRGIPMCGGLVWKNWERVCECVWERGYRGWGEEIQHISCCQREGINEAIKAYSLREYGGWAGWVRWRGRRWWWGFNSCWLGYPTTTCQNAPLPMFCAVCTPNTGKCRHELPMYDGGTGVFCRPLFQLCQNTCRRKGINLPTPTQHPAVSYLQFSIFYFFKYVLGSYFLPHYTKAPCFTASNQLNAGGTWTAHTSAVYPIIHATGFKTMFSITNKFVSNSKSHTQLAKDKQNDVERGSI